MSQSELISLADEISEDFQPFLESHWLMEWKMYKNFPYIHVYPQQPSQWDLGEPHK